MNTKLSADKLEAADHLRDFLLDADTQVFILNGPPGVGKTFFVNYILDTLVPQHAVTAKLLELPNQIKEVKLTATTNPASNLYVNHTCTTIHRLLGLTVYRGSLQQKRLPDIRDTLVIIDEYTMIDSQVKEYILKDILKPSLNNKLILVGDQDQFLAIGHTSPCFSVNYKGYTGFELTIPNRTLNEGILDSTRVIRDWIRNPESTLDWEPDGVGVRWSKESVEYEFKELLKTSPDSILLTYKNQDSQYFNSMARSVLGLGDTFHRGEELILNKPYFESGTYFPTDTLFVIDNFLGSEVFQVGSDTVTVDTYSAHTNIKGGFAECVSIIKNPEKYSEAKLKTLLGSLNTEHPLLDLRAQHSKTFHKAQGSSVDNVLIDLSSFSGNITRDVLLRSLYVTISRARKSVVMVGEFNETVRNKI